jgi:putative component of membrane protein insertase Oxa1/YidC/SpoIIIJ protein YidD
MKKLVLIGISLYQQYLSFIIKNVLGMPILCQQTPSCSEFARSAIQNDGLLKGGLRAMLRLLACQPFVRISEKYDRAF